MRKGLAIAVAALLTSACAAHDEGAGEDRSGRDAATAPDPEGDVAELGSTALTSIPERAALCAPPPVLLHDRMVWVDAAGLQATPFQAGGGVTTLARWEDGEVARSPLVAGGAEPRLVVATQRGAEATLRLFDAAGDPIGTLRAEASDSLGPTGGERTVLWPLVGDGLAVPDRVRWLQLDQGVTFDVELPARPRTSAVRIAVDERFGGGSHWLVGTDTGATVIDTSIGDRLHGDDPLPVEVAHVVTNWRSDEGATASVVLAHGRGPDGATRLFAVLSLVDGAEADGPDGVVGLGHRLRVVEVTPDASATGLSLVPRGAPIEAPGILTAHPVSIADCQSVAGGGSHWFCPGDDVGVVIGAGEGWVAAWGVPSGVPVFMHESATTYTGLAAGDGGWIAGGGSHWLPDEDDVWALELLRPPALGDDGGVVTVEGARGMLEGACVASPLWEADGTLVTPVAGNAGSAVARLSLGASDAVGSLARGPGFARPLGDNRNSGRIARSPTACADGLEREVFHADLVAGDEVFDVAGTIDGALVVVGRTVDNLGFVRRLDEDSADRREVLTATRSVEHVAARAEGGFVIAYTEAPVGPRRIVGRGAELEVQFNHPIDPVDGGLVALVEASAGSYYVGLQLGGADQVIHVDRALGVTGIYAYFPPDMIGLVDVLSDGQGQGAMVLVGDGVLGVRRFDGTALDRGFATWSAPVGRDIGYASGGMSADGVVRVVLGTTENDGPGDMRWLRIDAATGAVAERVLPWAGFVATAGDGASLMNTSLGLVRVGPEDGLGLPRVIEAGAMPLGIDRTGGVYTVVAQLGEGAAHKLVWAHADPHGFLSCARAGACVGVDASACDHAAVCEAMGCEPSSGACLSELLPDCTSP